MNFRPCKLFDADGDLSQRWFVFYFFKDPLSGKWLRIKEYISQRLPTRAQRYDAARDLKKKLDIKLRSGYNPLLHKGQARETLIESLDHLLEVKKECNRKRTYQTYKSHVKLFKEFLNNKKLEHLPTEDFDFHRALAFMDWIKTNHHLSNRTFNNYLQSLFTLFKMLCKRMALPVNPFSMIDPLPTEETSLIAFTESELIQMETYLPGWDYNLYVAACLIFYCFLRPNEIMQLKVKHIDLAGSRIIIPGGVSKNKKSEVIHIPKPLTEVLKRFDLKFPGEYYLFVHDLKRGTKRALPERLREKWNEFIVHAGIEKTLYSLKHTAIGMAIDAGINLRDLQLQIRHSSLEITQKYADRFRRTPSRELSEKFPSLSRLQASRMLPFHSPLLDRMYNPELSKN